MSQGGTDKSQLAEDRTKAAKILRQTGEDNHSEEVHGRREDPDRVGGVQAGGNDE